jgi:hypothetical protein
MIASIEPALNLPQQPEDKNGHAATECEFGSPRIAYAEECAIIPIVFLCILIPI